MDWMDLGAFTGGIFGVCIAWRWLVHEIREFCYEDKYLRPI